MTARHDGRRVEQLYEGLEARHAGSPTHPPRRRRRSRRLPTGSGHPRGLRRLGWFLTRGTPCWRAAAIGWPREWVEVVWCEEAMTARWRAADAARRPGLRSSPPAAPPAPTYPVGAALEPAGLVPT